MTAQAINVPVINSLDFARKAQEFRDIIPLLRFSRLGEYLADTDGALEITLIGKTDMSGKPAFHLVVQGVLKLVCQRCLDSFEYPLDVAADYVIVTSENAIPSPDSDEYDDEVDYLVAETQMPVIDLVEDEILLALPLAPKHAENECGGTGRVELEKPSPFAVLKGFKAGKSQND
ncbi:YceD family protein [Methylobacillus arboreus]|uniref:YceD family protein n=1 Tax=Methylobacillus arboreus TaxID=755170 RepID=UPI001E416EC5|nr:YceD family protein [Methylobacillus arboreus]MCB5189872.1 YceD family protein [Methylobacillus arboreus]